MYDSLGMNGRKIRAAGDMRERKTMTQSEIFQGKIPEFLREKLLGQYGEDLVDRIIKGYEREKPVTLRVNELRVDKELVIKVLASEHIGYRPVTWSESALIIEQGIREPRLKALEIYKTGSIYLQSLSSMIPPLILAPKPGESVLDMAAAPGGKTTQMAVLSQNMASITACEKNKIRAERLQYNIEKQGATRVCVMIIDARRLDDFFSFDKILLDAPCTGSGTLDMCHRDVKERFNQSVLKRSARLQEELLVKGLKLLKPGHEMIYSTCSILEEENEAVVRGALKKVKAEVIPIELEAFFEVPMLPVGIKGTLCVCPNDQYEGFFLARLRRKK